LLILAAFYDVEQFLPVADTTFLIDVPDMGFNGVFGKDQFFSDVGHASALGKQEQDILLAVG
jgi:hypothetical protein